MTVVGLEGVDDDEGLTTDIAHSDLAMAAAELTSIAW